MAYAALREQNEDMFGWIEIEGTTLDYPVMYTPDAPEYYLRRAFDGSSSWSGVPFLDGGYFEGCGNYLVYGHNMKNGTMFAELCSFASADYWQEHPIIYFDTPDETGIYVVLAAFYSGAYPVDATGVFRYYQYTDLTRPERFAEYIRAVQSAALYDTGITAEYGDQLLTFSTCEYHVENGRFVVVAKRLGTAD